MEVPLAVVSDTLVVVAQGHELLVLEFLLQVHLDLLVQQLALHSVPSMHRNTTSYPSYLQSLWPRNVGIGSRRACLR